MEAYKQSSPGDSECKIRFQKAFTKILDDVQSVINSPHTRKEKREKILALCENAQDIMKDILEKHKDNKKVTDILVLWISLDCMIYFRKNELTQPINHWLLLKKFFNRISFFYHYLSWNLGQLDCEYDVLSIQYPNASKLLLI